MLQKKTSKLFYGKYPYKIETSIPGASLIVRRGIEDTLKFCNSTEVLKVHWAYRSYVGINKVELNNYINLAQEFIDKDIERDIQIRAEGAHMNFFCKDVALYNSIKGKLQEWVVAVTEPGSLEELEYILSNGSKVVLVDAYRKGKFRYKLILKINMKKDKRLQFMGWLSNYSGKIEVARSTISWLIGTHHYLAEPFIYVDDKKTLTMIGLYISGYIKKVEEYVIRDTLVIE